MARSTTFTSYVNIEPAKGVDASLSALERKASATMARIAAQAQKASTSTSGARPGTSAAQTQQMATAERQRAQALQQTVTASNAAAAASSRLASRHILESNAARAAASSTTALERSLRLASVAANVAQGPLGPLAGRLSAIAVAVRELTGIPLGLVGAGALGLTFVRAASSAQELKSKLYPLFDSQTQVNAAFKDTIRIANEARLSLEPVVDLYSRLTLGGRDVGLSQQRVAALTETAAKAAKLSGGTQQSQDAGLYQFAQGIGSGNLGGDELKSVRENTLRLAKAIADGLGVSIAELKKMGAEGKLTATVIAGALESQRERIDAELAKLPATIASSTAKLNTAFLALVNGTDEAYGVTATLAGGMLLLADNLALVTRAVIGLAIAYASIRAANMAKNTYESVAAWNAQRQAIIANRAAVATQAQEQVNAAAVARTASAERIVALRAERAALEANVAAEQQAAATTRNTRNDLTRKVDGGRYPGRALDIIALKKATDEATIAEQRLTFAQDRQREVAMQLHQTTGTLTSQNLAYRNALLLSNAASGRFVANTANMRSALGSLRAETGSLIVAKQRLRGAMDAASKSANFFAAAGRSLWGVIGPNLLGLALGVGINLLLQWATAQDAAAAAADRMAAREAQLAGIIDFTTGKVLIQNQALRENAGLKAQQGLQEAATDFNAARAGLTATPQSGGNIARFGYQPEEPGSRVLGQLQAGLINITTARRQLMEMKAPGIAFDRLNRFEAATTGMLRQNLGVKILSGTATAKDYAIAGMPAPGAAAPGAGGSGAGAADKKLGGARRERAAGTAAAAKAERELQRAQDAADKRTDIISRYEEQSNAMRRAAKDVRELQQMVGKFGYTQERANTDRATIEYGIRQPIRDAIDEQKRGLDVGRLRLAGYEEEAGALEKALSLQDNIGSVTREELETLIANEKAQLRINDALDSRARSVEGILNAANQTRDAFENMLVGLQRNPGDALKQFGSTILDNIARVQARQLTEKLFAGADETLRELISGSSGVDRANELLVKNVRTTADSLPPMATAAEQTAAALTNSAAVITAANERIAAGGGIDGLASPIGVDKASGRPITIETAFDAALGSGKMAAVTSVVSAVAGVATGAGAALSALPGLVNAANDNASSSGIGPDFPASEANPNGYIGVTAARKASTYGNGPVGDPGAAYASVFMKPIERLADVVGIKLPKGLEKTLGKALSGVGYGMAASGVLGALGVKQSQTGAAIGGALGGAFFGPLGGAIGGAIFGTLGKLFGSAKTGSVTLGQNQFGYAGITGTGGNNAEQQKVVSGLGGSVSDQLNQIADAFGANIGAFNVSIGKRNDEYRVSSTGGNTTGKKANSSDIIYKGKDEEAAIAAAVQNAIEDGAITGISQAAQNILKSGQTLQTAINKALAIESIPKRLMQKLDPVKYAVTQLNEEFTKLISYLKEGGATAEQFADASKLYDLERADAMKQVAQQSIAAIQGYLDEMKGGASSPFNKRTVYENAAAKLASFRGDINAGKVVNETDLLTAAKNFQDASRNLNGSSEAFFNDYNDLFALLTKARDNVSASSTVTGTLPDSPFSTPEMVTYLSQLNQTTASQTDILGSKLDAILAAIQNGTALPSDYTYLSAMNLLPGVAA